MHRKRLAMALALLMTAGWAFAEGQTENDRLSFTTDDHMTISWGGLTSELTEEGNPVQRHLEEKFNVTIVTAGVSRSDEEAKQLFMSSGEYPEAFYTWIDMVDWYHKGAFRTIPRDMIETYAPLHSLPEPTGAAGLGREPGAGDYRRIHEHPARGALPAPLRRRPDHAPGLAGEDRHRPVRA